LNQAENVRLAVPAAADEPHAFGAIVGEGRVLPGKGEAGQTGVNESAAFHDEPQTGTIVHPSGGPMGVLGASRTTRHAPRVCSRFGCVCYLRYHGVEQTQATVLPNYCRVSDIAQSSFSDGVQGSAQVSRRNDCTPSRAGVVL
jgi:hypothetical protein